MPRDLKPCSDLLKSKEKLFVQHISQDFLLYYYVKDQIDSEDAAYPCKNFNWERGAGTWISCLKQTLVAP